jgi:hypothetical protein
MQIWKCEKRGSAEEEGVYIPGLQLGVRRGHETRVANCVQSPQTATYVDQNERRNTNMRCNSAAQLNLFELIICIQKREPPPCTGEVMLKKESIT